VSRIVRQSKYRHVFGNAEKKENTFDNVKVSASAWDSNKVDGNNKFVAAIWEAGGGGSFAVIPNEQTGKVSSDLPLVSGHKGAVLDLAFSPFNDYLIASVSEDGNGRIWSIPEGGLKSNLNDPTQTLIGHRRKVGTVNFHPTAENILATSSTDYSIKIWDIAKGEAALSVSGHSDIIQSVAWDFLGTQLVTTSKDKKLRLVDPRASTVTAEVLGHPGVKGSRCIFLGRKDLLFNVGFSRTSDRCYSILDQRKLDTPLAKANIDTASGILMPFYDDDTSLLFLAGKGDGNIRYYEIDDEKPYIHYIADYKSPVPQLGMGKRPKTACDIGSCEVVQLLKACTTYIEPIHFVVPRKSELFQDDIFPDTPGPDPALKASEWLAGQTKEPVRVSLERGFVPRDKSEFKPTVVVEVKEEKPRTDNEWRNEVDTLTKRVAYLEAELIKKDATIKQLGGN
jgi:coronin-1B/1C/6